jgi:hypothetical protein
LQDVVAQIRQHIDNPLLPLPNVQQGRRRRRLFVAEEQCRRSTRIKELARGQPGSYVKRAQRVLMTKLGICNVEGEPEVDCLEKYAEYFRGPLSPARVEALAKLFFLDATAQGELFV